MIEYVLIHLYHYHEEELEEDGIPPPLLCPLPTPHLLDKSMPNFILRLHNTRLSLFYDIITPPLWDIHRNHALLKVVQSTNISP